MERSSRSRHLKETLVWYQTQLYHPSVQPNSLLDANADKSVVYQQGTNRHTMGSEKTSSRPVADHGSINADMDHDPAMEKRDGGEITQIQGDAHFYETVSAAPLNPWSKTSLQLYMILLVAALNATASGFDGVRSKSNEWCTFIDARLLTCPLVHLQLYQCHGSIQGVLSPY